MAAITHTCQAREDVGFSLKWVIIPVLAAYFWIPDLHHHIAVMFHFRFDVNIFLFKIAKCRINGRPVIPNYSAWQVLRLCGGFISMLYWILVPNELYITMKQAKMNLSHSPATPIISAWLYLSTEATFLLRYIASMHRVIEWTGRLTDHIQPVLHLLLSFILNRAPLWLRHWFVGKLSISVIMLS